MDIRYISHINIHGGLYIDSLDKKSPLILTGDFNHGAIRADGNYDNQSRRFFDFQMLGKSLATRTIKLAPIEGNSYKYMKLDHIFTSEKLRVLDAEYLDLFSNHQSKIGVYFNHNKSVNINTTP